MSRTIKIRGKYWFEAKYAASLLGTTARKIEVFAIRKLIKSREDESGLWVAEADVTRLRGDSSALKALKKKAAEPAAKKAPKIGGRHQVSANQDVLPIADYRLPLHRGKKFKD